MQLSPDAVLISGHYHSLNVAGVVNFGKGDFRSGELGVNHVPKDISVRLVPSSITPDQIKGKQ